MKKNLLKRCGCIIIAAALTISMTACGEEEVPIASKENVFSATEVELPLDYDYIQQMVSSGDQIYIIGNITHEDLSDPEDPIYTSDTILSILDSDGNSINSLTLASTESVSDTSTSINNMTVNDDGSLYLLINEYTWNEETYESTENRYIAKYDSSGNEQGVIDLNSLESNDESTYFWVDNMLVGDDGNIYMTCNNNIYVIDTDGNLLFTIESEESTDTSNTWINALCKTADGKIAAIVNNYYMDGEDYVSETTAKIIDSDTKDYKDEYPLKSSYSGFYNGNADYDLCASTSNSLVGIDFETGEDSVIIDWLKSGFDTTTMSDATILPDGRILCTTYKYESSGGGYSWSNSDIILTFLTKVDPADVPDKQLITLSTLWLSYTLKQRIVEFNKESELYQIEVTSYYDDYDGTSDSALTKFNNDLVSGNIPDIIVLSDDMPIDSYISKGILSDLYTYIDNDETINREDYLTNVFDALSTNGKLYQITPSFDILTLVGKTSIVGEDEGWTMADYLAVANANPDKAMFNELTKSNFLSEMLYCTLGSYVNSETGECSFNSDSFKQLLEAANVYPDEIDYEELYSDDDYWQELETSYRTGNTILYETYLYNFSQIKEIEQGRFGETVTFIGFPSDEGNGAMIIPDMHLTISSKANNSDGAWEFIKYFLSEDYQMSVSERNGSFPIMESAYTSIMEEAKEKPYYLDENGEKVEYDNSYWIGDSSVTIDVNTDEDNERMMNYIKSATTLGKSDSSLTNIILEEAEAYFSGQKTVDEVADIIQNRAGTYVSENR
ncbi:MAG: extracellular solute-binding protein [Oscillospiraceae bacterium]|nr:extracellular solute-binding protein [Oscillospiraceae bacterium]